MECILLQDNHIKIEYCEVEQAEKSFYTFTLDQGHFKLDYLLAHDFLCNEEHQAYRIMITIEQEYLSKYGNFTTIPEQKRPCCALQIQIYELLHCKLQGAQKLLFLESSVLFILHLLKNDNTHTASPCLFDDKTHESLCIKVKHAQEYILENLSDKLSIALIATKVGTNENYLKRQFKLIMGCTIFEFIRENRMIKAKYLLQNTDKQVKEIALETGYSSISSFSQSFKKFFGFSPKTINQETFS